MRFEMFLVTSENAISSNEYNKKNNYEKKSWPIGQFLSS